MATSTIHKVRTDEIFTSLLIQHGRKPVDDLDTSEPELSRYLSQMSETLGRKEHLRQYGRVSGEPVRHCQEIFISTDGNVKNPESILLTGKAGIGKTLFCQKLIRDWAYDKLFQSQTNVQVPDFKFAYLLTFRQLNFLGDDRVTLKEILNQSSVLDDHSNIDDSLFEYIVGHADEVLIIIDGYDEYSQQDFIATNLDDQYPNNAQEEMPVAALCTKLIKGKILRGSVVMITSRPDESDKMKLDGIGFDRYIEISGFSEQQVTEYIEKYFKENKRMKKAVIDHITKNDDLVSFAHIPVLCFLMCSYFEYILNESMNTDALSVKTSDLYFEVINMFLRKHTRKKGISPEDTLDKLSELTAQLLLEKRFLFVEENAKKFTSEEIENLRASGLLHCGPPFKKSFSETTKHFCFTHMTLQEYLAARWFVKRKEAPSRNVVSGMVLQFMSGILSTEQNGNKFMEELLEKIHPSTNKPTNASLLVTAKCLTEYQDTEFAKDMIKKRYHQLCGLTGEIEFSKLTDVDCTAVSFLLDVISALNAEQAATKKQTIPEQSRAVSNLAILSSYLTQSGVQRIFKTLEKDFCAITNLWMLGCQLNDECVQTIGELLPVTKLNELSLFGNQITDAGVVSLCQALQTPACKVTTLDLSYNQITDAGVASLCQALQTPTCKVTTLYLTGNQITDAGVVSLCQELQTPTCKVTTLDLCYNQITDAGVVSLCQALQTPTCKVTTLYLTGNQITDGGVVSLCQALQTPTCKVTTLYLSDNQFTDGGEQRLRNLLKQKPHLDLNF